MNKYTLLVVSALLLLISYKGMAQKYQWAQKVVKVSSQQASGNNAHSPNKVLGEPDAFPIGQENTEAWSPKSGSSSEEFIQVQFLKSMPVSQIVVVENVHPGAISKIELVSTGGKRYEVYSNPNPGPIPAKFRVLQQTFPQTKYRVLGVVVTLQPDKVGGTPQIDAIGISETEEIFIRKELQN
ncbi:MAG: hypothetical protein LPK19_16800, partial [Hymenobacteraceae bacterium]|nr:hypothetical protein [Hymenobacteraceae bacterium]MDX5397912.1 hypothetical protein [Hymenobacteraceae bacterium]MDX5513983.1 hypothetical protein [Hymenobacteraceae bacterium]